LKVFSLCATEPLIGTIKRFAGRLVTVKPWAIAKLTTQVETLDGLQERMKAANKLVKKGDLVVITTGTPFLKKGTTNTLIVESV